MNEPLHSDDVREGQRVAPLSRQPRHYDPDRRQQRLTRKERLFSAAERLAWLLVFGLLVAVVGLTLQFSPDGAFAWRKWLLPLAGGHLGHMDELTADRYLNHTRPLLVAQTVDVASTHLHAALEPTPDTLAGASRTLDALRRLHDTDRAEHLLALSQTRFGKRPELEHRSVHLLLDRGRIEDARDHAWDAIDRHGPLPSLLDALNDTFQHDPRFETSRIHTLEPERDFDRLEPTYRLGLQLDAPRGDAELAVFAPHTRAVPLNHLAPISAFRLATIMRLQLALPAARPARVKLAPVEVAARTEGYLASWREPMVVNTDRDGQWAYGAWFNLPNDPRRFPAEHLPLWQPWLAAGATTTTDPGSALLALEALRDNRPRHVPIDRLQQLVGDHSTAWLAARVSDLLTLIYLTNNPLYRRKGGHMVLLTPLGLLIPDFGLAFATEARPELLEMLPHLQRFRPSTILALRVLDRRRVDPWLFPDLANDPAQRAAADAFWERHRTLLAHIETLEQTHGAAAVAIPDSL